MITELLITLIGLIIALAAYSAPIAIIVLIILYLKKRKKTEQNRKQNEQNRTDWKWNNATKQWENIYNQAETIKNEEPNKKEEPINQPKSRYSQLYQAKNLLTPNEWYEYRKLRDIAEAKNLRVCPKVRLLDLVEPRRGEGYMSLLGKIQSKHVDFVITDRELHIKAIIELDDNSHNRPDRQDRDNFVNEVLTSVGYKLIRTRSITEDTINGI